MNNLSRRLVLVFLLLFFKSTQALEASVPMQVWVNQAIVNLFTFSFDNWESRQKDMASYFTTDAWQAYLKAMNQSNIITVVKNNKYTVSAVATLPPSIKLIGKNLYEASMPIIVSYKNADKTQVQHLTITLHVFETTNTGFGKYAINQFLSKVDTMPCMCKEDNGPKVTIV